MNEIQIIQQQLATERLHFAEVANACASALDSESLTGASEFTHACTDYFGFAVTRLDADCKSGGQLATARSADAAAAEGAWREFLREFNADIERHFKDLDENLTRAAPITQWRVLSRIDADSIYTERELYERVKKTLPTGITLAALAAFLP